MNPLNLFINGHNVLLIVFIAFVLSACFTPFAIRVAKHVGALDYPDGKRKVHDKPMPRMGGLAIFLSFLIAYMIFVPKNTQMLSVLIGSFLIILLGFTDDVKPLSAKSQFIGQVCAASVIVFYGNITFSDMQIFGHYFQ